MDSPISQGLEAHVRVSLVFRKLTVNGMARKKSIDAVPVSASVVISISAQKREGRLSRKCINHLNGKGEGEEKPTNAVEGLISICSLQDVIEDVNSTVRV